MAYKHFKKRTNAEQWDIDRPRIHALKNKVIQLRPGFSVDNYRDIILDISNGKHDSSKDLNAVQRRSLIDRLSVMAGEEQRPLGPRGSAWQPPAKSSYPNRPKNMDRPGESRADQLGKIEALLTVGKKAWHYADGIAKRICKIDKIAWVPTGQLYKVITALRMQAKREGWDLSGETK